MNCEFLGDTSAKMSADVVSLQLQVEAVLGTLVKAASLELIKLFESRYRASAVDPGRRERAELNESWDPLLRVWNGESKRSIGVQVEEDIRPPVELDSDLLLDPGCLKEPDPSQVLLAEDTDQQWAPLKDQIPTDHVDKLELNMLLTDDPLNGDPPEDTVPPVSSGTSSGTSECKRKPLVIQPDKRSKTSGEQVKFVCPLILKVEGSEEPVQAEPQQACVSTARGTAYSPSPSDGAVTPAQVGVWERIHSPKDTKNHLQMKLKFTYSDQKLLLPCAVQLVDLLKIPDVKDDNAAKALNANDKPGPSKPKDLRRHQGPHTGHRLCCFTRCEKDLWRLQNVVTHSRDGYVCDICGKAFKRRKILRRHERFHTGERPYPCSKCTKTFALRKSLRRHLRFHTGERPHTCTQCGKSFRLRDNLKAHLRFHSGEKPYGCNECGKTFRIMRNLDKHKLSLCEFLVPSFRAIAGL
ncbi:PREDICTED: zinc finger and SCAN domain-containing protein 21-like [Cyprinodon variegatus]|uniref:Zinc finger and SCAN domain-containing protein 21-like n=1 Tax=Cyprinodon variegatus TaxID=28743 RepID=A0A3Q2DSW0_CYPVA|nr:PREDICTED: zinc finger and SCAN domain-containing protein 21-like [Cyprinodon variegatus]